MEVVAGLGFSYTAVAEESIASCSHEVVVAAEGRLGTKSVEMKTGAVEAALVEACKFFCLSCGVLQIRSLYSAPRGGCVFLLVAVLAVIAVWSGTVIVHHVRMNCLRARSFEVLCRYVRVIQKVNSTFRAVAEAAVVQMVTSAAIIA